MFTLFWKNVSVTIEEMEKRIIDGYYSDKPCGRKRLILTRGKLASEGVGKKQCRFSRKLHHFEKPRYTRVFMPL